MGRMLLRLFCSEKLGGNQVRFPILSTLPKNRNLSKIASNDFQIANRTDRPIVAFPQFGVKRNFAANFFWIFRKNFSRPGCTALFGWVEFHFYVWYSSQVSPAYVQALSGLPVGQYEKKSTETCVPRKGNIMLQTCGFRCMRSICAYVAVPFERHLQWNEGEIRHGQHGVPVLF